MTNEEVKNLLDSYRETYYNTSNSGSTKYYWNAGVNGDNLSSTNWGITKSKGGTSNNYYNYSECYGFSLFMARVVFNKELRGTIIEDAGDGASLGDGWVIYKNDLDGRITLEPGDVVRRKAPDDGGYPHSVMVWYVDDDDYVYVVDCNGSGDNDIDWRKWYSPTTMKDNKAYRKVSEILERAEYVIKAPKTSDTDPGTITVTFNPNGGTCSMSSKKVTSGQPYGALPIPKRSGYEFMGWYTSSTMTSVERAYDTEVTKTTPHTLYAQWGRVCKIVNSETSKCLTVSGESEKYLSSGDSVTAENYTGKETQKWLVPPNLSNVILKPRMDIRYGVSHDTKGSEMCANVRSIPGQESNGTIDFDLNMTDGSYCPKMMYYNVYLTAPTSTQSTDVRWFGRVTSNNSQYWFIEYLT